MTKAFVTLAVGPHEEFLEIAMPSFEEFADRHDYDIVTAQIESDRPPSWWKVPALLAALDEYDEAIFVGADIVITDPSEDFEVPAAAWHALVEHHTADGAVPNADVWYLRQAMIPVLVEMWRQVDLIQHGWWEQAALMRLMGYQLHPARLKRPTELHAHTHILDPGWNVHRWDKEEAETPRFMHATMYEDRAAVMREWAAEAVAC